MSLPRTLSALAACAALFSATAANAGWMPEGSPAAWALWTARAQGIYDDLQAGRSVEAHCKGVRGELIKNAMPLWAQGIIPLCDALTQAQTGHLICRAVNDDYSCADEVYGINKRQTKAICQETRAAVGQLKGAKPVEAAPEAEALGQKLVLVGLSLKKYYGCLM